MVRRVCNHAAYFLFLFLHGLLAVPLTRHKFRECAALLLPQSGVALHNSGRRNGEIMHQGISQEISQKIKNMSLLCALLVVSIHVSWPQEPLSAGWFLSIAIKEGYARIAVPFFFVVSGFLLAGHFDEEKWWHHEVGKRVRTLVVPFLIWSLVALVTSVPLSIIADLIAHRPFGTSIYIFHSINCFF